MIFNSYRFKICVVFLVLLFLITAETAFAQTGTLKGYVYDKTSNEVLLGTNVTIKNTSLGAATDLYGNYFISNIPIGKQIVIVSYIGYQPDTISVNVLSGKIIEQNFYLNPSVLEGETVVVTAQAKGQ